MEKKPVLHLMVNNKCDNDCPLCCNKQYDIKDVPVVTEEDLLSIDEICFTGGQPLRNFDAFLSLFNGIRYYENIKYAYIYANGAEFSSLNFDDKVKFHDIMLCNQPKTSLTLSPKCEDDWRGVEYIHDVLRFERLYTSNFLYCFNNQDYARAHEMQRYMNIIPVKREWQKDFKPAPNTFFRRLPIWLE